MSVGGRTDWPALRREDLDVVVESSAEEAHPHGRDGAPVPWNELGIANITVRIAP
jgi:hypothetical protein